METENPTNTHRNHLFHDLQPYLCIFEPCSRTANPFESRQEWVSHIVCHVIELNGQSDPERPVLTCPLCLEDMKGRHAKHLSGHLEEIALGAVVLHADVDTDSSSVATDEEDEDEEGPEDEHQDEHQDAHQDPHWNGFKSKKNCLCGKADHGDKIVCDNNSCLYEFFHLSCLDLMTPPSGLWLCDNCSDDGYRASARPVHGRESYHELSGIGVEEQEHIGLDSPPVEISEREFREDPKPSAAATVSITKEMERGGIGIAVRIMFLCCN